jgi:aryl-alcohol dehydrogenase-like predicted oxidoreductase
VTTFHSSHEYEGHEFFARVLAGVRRARPAAELVHIAKIAVPHFEEHGFSAARFRAHVERQRQVLGAERLDLVQWLVRSKPIADGPRLATLARSVDELSEVWERLVEDGKVGALASFPYSPAFARAVSDVPVVSGLCSYLNLDELDDAPLLDRLAAGGKGFVALRPLHAGALAASLEEALTFPLLHPVVASIVLGVSSIPHADAALDVVARVRPDPARFRAIAARGRVEPDLAG